MRTASKFLIFFLSFVLVLLVASMLWYNGCQSEPNIIITVPKMETTNLTSEQTRRVTRSVREQVARYGTVKNSNSTSGVDKIVTGLVSRADQVYIITLTVEDLKSGKTRQTTKNLKGSFDNFLTKKVKSAVDAIMK